MSLRDPTTVEGAPASFYPPEDRQLEVFPKAVNVSKADFSEPAALVFDKGKNVGVAVGSFHEVAAYLLQRHVVALLLAPQVEMLRHGIVEHLLAPRRGAGDVFAIQEHASFGQ